MSRDRGEGRGKPRSGDRNTQPTNPNRFAWHRQWAVRHQEYAGEHSLEGDGPPQMTPIVHCPDRILIQAEEGGGKGDQNKSEPSQGDATSEDVSLADAEEVIHRMSTRAREEVENEGISNTVRQFMNKLAKDTVDNVVNVDDTDSEWNGDKCAGKKPAQGKA